MKVLALTAISLALLTLTGCGDAASVNSSDPEALKARSEQLEAQAVQSLENKDLGDVIDYFSGEAEDMTSVLKSVTDGPSAEAAVVEIRATIPQINAAMQTLANQDPSEMRASFSIMTKLPAMLQTQTEMINEVKRISEIPEARAVLETEFDNLDLFK